MIQVLLLLALLTCTYALTVASFAWEDLALGLGLSIVLLAVFRRTMLPSRLQSSATTIKGITMLPLYMARVVWSIVTGTVAVTIYVLGIRQLRHPGIVSVPIGQRTPGGVAVTALALTLSPGSFLVDVDWEERVMFVHVMDASEPAVVREELQTMYDRYQRHIVP
jgi:multicomponent Na+:H+ antiporter subunit E